jgi:hypothetical protein
MLKPAGVIWSYDEIYSYQLIERIVSTGFLKAGEGFGAAFYYSFYPNSFILASAFSLITGIDPLSLMKFIGVVLNFPIVIGIYLLATFLAKDHKVGVVSSLIYVLNPLHLTFHSNMNYETAAISQLPLLLYQILKSRSISYKAFSVAMVLIEIFTIGAHHWVSYNLFLMSILICVAVYLPMRFFSDWHPTRRYFLPAVIIGVMLFSWSIYLAVKLFEAHLSSIPKLFEIMFTPREEFVYSFPVSPIYQKLARYIFYMVALIFSFIGLYKIIARMKVEQKVTIEYSIILILSAVYFVLTFVLFVLKPFAGTFMDDVASRIFGMSFIWASIIGGIGLAQLMYSTKRYVTPLKLWVLEVLVISAVLNAYGPSVFDPNVGIGSLYDGSAFPAQRQHFGFFIGAYTYNSTFIGLEDINTAVSGFGCRTIKLGFGEVSVNNLLSMMDKENIQYFAFNSMSIRYPVSPWWRTPLPETFYNELTVSSCLSKVFDNGIHYLFFKHIC